MRFADVRVLLCVVLLCASPLVGDAQAQSHECFGQSTHVIVKDGLANWLREVMPRSITLLRQCAVLADAPRLRVIVTLPRGRLFGSRARTTIWRSPSLILAHVEISITVDFAELLAHEFEHILEQVEGLNLAQLADAGSDTVYRTSSGAFETRRARAAGLATRREVLDGPGPQGLRP